MTRTARSWSGWFASALTVWGLAWSPVAQAAPTRAYRGPGAVESPIDGSAPRVVAEPEAPPPVVTRPLEVGDDPAPTRAGEESGAYKGRTPPAEPRSDIQVRLGLDLAITLGAAAPTLGLALWVEPSLPDVTPMPGTEPDVGKFDELALGRYEEAPAIASDVLLGVAIAAPLSYLAAEAALQRRGYSNIRGRGFLARYGTDLIIMAEAIAINSLLTQILKAAIRRPRPFTYLLPSEVDADQREELLDDQSSFQADWSFPSGHTSTAFVITTAGATLLTLKQLGRSNWAVATAWVGGIGLSTTVGVMRVLAGRHFPSDVVTSALLGMGVGAAVPLAHWRPATPGDRVQRGPLRNMVLSPMMDRHTLGLSLGGALP